MIKTTNLSQEKASPNFFYRLTMALNFFNNKRQVTGGAFSIDVYYMLNPTAVIWLAYHIQKGTPDSSNPNGGGGNSFECAST